MRRQVGESFQRDVRALLVPLPEWEVHSLPREKFQPILELKLVEC